VKDNNIKGESTVTGNRGKKRSKGLPAMTDEEELFFLRSEKTSLNRERCCEEVRKDPGIFLLAPVEEGRAEVGSLTATVALATGGGEWVGEGLGASSSTVSVK
jgi:hypothetical protein